MKILKKSITFQNMEDAREKRAKNNIIICLAIVKKNPFTEGLKGTIGDKMVFKQVQGRTIATYKGVPTGEPTEKQLEQRGLFQEATIYGKWVMSDPEAKAEYEAKKSDKYNSAYAIAVADFLKAPEIEEVDLSAFHGHVGDVIKVKAKDDFKVMSVSVDLFDLNGAKAEGGMAVEDKKDLNWNYTLTTEIASLTGTKIVVKASDKPGHVTEKEQTV
jgi:hypothetical protein